VAILDTTALTAVLKQQYTQSKVYLLAYKNNPFYSQVRKKTNFVGQNKVVAIRNGTPQGRSVAFATGQSNKTASKYNRFTVTRVSDYAFAEISGEAILASKGDAGALLEGLKTEIDGAIYTCMRSIAIALFRNGGGSRGQISATSNVATPTITLATLTDITNFEIGMKVVACSADGSGAATALRSAGATATITGLDRDLGTLTISGNWSASIAAVAASDFLFQQGDYDGTTAGGLMLKGLGAWLPTTAPVGGDSFFGLDRSSDVTRLAGIRYVGGGGPIEETLIEAAARAAREGAQSDMCFLNPLDYSNLVKALGAKVVYDRVQAVDMPDIGFKAVMLDGPMGAIKVLPDLNCPKGTAYLLQMDTWSFESLGDAPRILDLDDQPILRMPTSDSYEVRIGYYGNLVCEAPNYNVNIQL